MTTAAQTLRDLTDLLLDRTGSPGVHREATQAWYRAALVWSGMGADADALAPTQLLMTDQLLPSGKAISPIGAARCVVEYQRTAVFLRAMDAALRAARERFPGETIHVLEAGCGPLAPLALPFALRYPPEQVQFTLLDVHAASLEHAARLADELGVRGSIRGWIEADATRLRLTETDRPHVIACEVLLAALAKEPQVAVTMNLAPQLRSGGLFLPERIDVDAVLFDPHERFQPIAGPWSDAALATRGITELGPVFSLEAAQVAGLRIRADGTLPARTVEMPPHDYGRGRLNLATRLRVFGEHTLGDFDSSLNLPRPVKYDRETAASGATFAFAYELSATPGLRVTDVRPGAPAVGA